MRRRIITILVILAVIGAGWFLYSKYTHTEDLDKIQFYSGNGRLEATEVNIATKLAGRIEEIMVDEGDTIKRGQVLAVMQTNVLEAELAQAKARHHQAVTAAAGAKAIIDVRISEKEVAKAVVLQRESNLDGARKRYERLKTLRAANVSSEQDYEDSETLLRETEAQLAAANASVKQADAAIESAKADALGAAAAIQAAAADIARIQADIDDSTLLAPRDGRIQYRIAQPGEVLSAGGRVLNLVDLTDVYMTFYLPEQIAGRVKIGADVRITFDALPGHPVPAYVSYVASVAQFTPKMVETQSERQKLMFRVKARIRPELLKKYIDLVKTGVPGVAWVQLDSKAKWPADLEVTPLGLTASGLAVPEPIGTPDPAAVSEPAVASDPAAAVSKPAASEPKDPQ